MTSFIEKLVIVFYFIKYRYFLKFNSRENLLNWQKKSLNRFLNKTKKKSKFYNSLWLNKEFKDYPLVNKAIMMENFNDLNTANLNLDECLNLAIESETSRDFTKKTQGITVGLSSGTSGHRGLFVASDFERAKYAGTILAKALPKGRVFKKNKVALFLRANSNLYKTVKSKLISFEFYDILKDISFYKNNLESYQPDLLIAQPSVLKLLSKMKNNGELNIQPYRIFSAAEVLEPQDRIYIETSFKTKLHQIYQCTEGFLGISCENGTLHLNEDLMMIERDLIENHPRKFQPIISDFNRITQPIIRYKLNDILTVSETPCVCGSPLLSIETIDGRSDDSIYFSKNTNQGWQIIWSDLIRNHILYVKSTIEEYFIHQNTNASLEISLKTNDDSLNTQKEIQAELQKLANKMDCHLPDIQFKKYVNANNFAKKVRRITSDFKPTLLDGL